MGIKQKVLYGFIVIAFILFLSGLTSIFELGRMRNSMSKLLSNNVANISSSRLLLEVTDEQIYHLLSQIGIASDSTLNVAAIYSDTRFDTFMKGNRRTYSTKMEHAASDTIMYAYAAYMQVMNEAPAVWASGNYQARRSWYDNVLQPVYQKLRAYIQKLIVLEQSYLKENTDDLQAGFYRSIMPGVISIGTGIILVFLFYYFINFYLLAPIQNMSRALRHYTTYRTPYDVKLKPEDDLYEFNQDIQKLAK